MNTQPELKSPLGSCGRTRLAIVASGIKQRCTNPKHRSYKNYGSKGIKLYDGWANDYGAFEEYCLLNGWRVGLQVDRINNEGNYEPGNIRFVSPSKNQQNKRNNKFTGAQVREIKILRLHGSTMQSIADKFGVNSGKISRICSGDLWHGIEIDPSLFPGAKPFNNKSHKFTYQQVLELLSEHYDNGTPIKRLAKIHGIAPNNMRYILRGVTWKEAYAEFFKNRPQPNTSLTTETETYHAQQIP